jgi:hypothetical protein
MTAALAGTSTITVKDSVGATKTFDVVTDGSGNFIALSVICDQAAAATCASVGTAGSPSTNAMTVQAVTLGHGTAANAMRVELPTDGTGLVNAAQSGTWNVTVNTALPAGSNQIGTVNPATPATWGLSSGQNASAPTNDILSGCQFNTSPTTISTTNVSPTQCNNVGSLLIDMKSMGNTAISSSCVANYGTSPGAVACPSANTFVTNANTNGQKTMANSSPVVIASDQSVGDPCTFQAKTNVAISTATGTTALVTGVSAKKIYVCSLALVVPSAVSVSLSEGSSSTCGTSNQAAVIGVATNGTAANGMPFAANGGVSYGSGSGTVAQTATAANYLCLFQSGTAQIAGNLTYVQQ